jgi:hypothetical protein
VTPQRLITYGSVPVPYSVLWSDEDTNTIEADPMVRGQFAMCNPSSRGQGKPMFGKPHMQRQREVVINGLCDLCAKPLKGRTKVSLSHAKVRAGAEGLCVMQVEPLLHKECAAISMLHCPSLKRDIRDGGLNVRLVTRYQVQLAQLTAAATMEFAGVRHSGAIGHAKVVLLAWQDKSQEWLG